MVTIVAILCGCHDGCVILPSTACRLQTNMVLRHYYTVGGLCRDHGALPQQYNVIVARWKIIVAALLLTGCGISRREWIRVPHVQDAAALGIAGHPPGFRVRFLAVSAVDVCWVIIRYQSQCAVLLGPLCLIRNANEACVINMPMQQKY